MGKEKKGLSRKEFLKTSAVGAGVVGSTGILSATQKVLASGSGVKWGFVIDLDRCIGCKACAIACKAEFDVRLGVFRSQVIYNEHGSYPKTKKDFLPWMCNHCDNAPCIPVCPVDPIDAEFEGVRFKKRATYKRPDGAILVDQDRCIGCGECIRNCPYKARFFDPAKRSGGDPDEYPASKCDLCVHRLDAKIVPSCVNTCQGRARIIGDLNDPYSEVSKLLKKHKVEVLLPEKATKPQVYYIGNTKRGINDSLKWGEDIRIEANSQYQLEIWKEGPYGS
jgi:tetrathionate reductase subunit B